MYRDLGSMVRENFIESLGFGCRMGEFGIWLIG